MEHLTFSVIIPVRNGAATLATQLEALCEQSFKGAFEIIVADNGSSDGTRDVVANFENGPSAPVRLIDASEVAGVSAARNIAVSHARAGLLAFCDADDRVHADWLAALATVMESAEFAAGTDVFWSETRGEEARNWSWNTAAKPHLGLLPFARGGNFAMRRSAFERIGGFALKWRRTQDVEFSWRAQLAGVRLVPALEAKVYYRIRRTKIARMAQVFRWSRNEVEIIRELGLDAGHIRLRDHTRSFLKVVSAKPRSEIPVLAAKRLGHLYGCLRHDTSIW